MSDEKLISDLLLAQNMGDWEKALQITEEIKKRKSPVKGSDIVEEFNKNFEKLKKRIKNKDPKKQPTVDELKDFFIQDVKNFSSTIDKNISNLENSKNTEIERLQKKLNTALLDVPGFTEQFSLKKRRIVEITKKLNKFEEDPDYPKSFLTYAMAITKSKRRGIGEGVKRSRVKARWNKKSENMKEELKNLEEKLIIEPNDSDHKQMIKTLLREKIQKAKLAYIENVKKNIGI